MLRHTSKELNRQIITEMRKYVELMRKKIVHLKTWGVHWWFRELPPCPRHCTKHWEYPRHKTSCALLGLHPDGELGSSKSVCDAQETISWFPKRGFMEEKGREGQVLGWEEPQHSPRSRGRGQEGWREVMRKNLNIEFGHVPVTSWSFYMN